MEEYKFWHDVSGETEFPIGIRQLAMINNDMEARRKYGEDSGVINIGFAARMRMPMNYENMEIAIRRIYNENDTMRLLLVKHGDTYKQKVIEEYPYKLVVYEAEGETKEERLKNAMDIATEIENTHIDWFSELSCKIFLVKIDTDDHLFVFLAHHWIGDGSTSGLIMDEMARYYMDPQAPCYEKGRFIDFLRDEYKFIESEEGKKQFAYWQKETAGYKLFDLTKASIGEPASGFDHAYKIDRSVIDRIAAAQNTNTFNVFLLAYHIATSFMMGTNDTIIGVASANRTSKKYFRTMGYIAHCIPHRVIISDQDKLSDLLAFSKNKFSENMSYLKTAHCYNEIQFFLSYNNFVAGSKSNTMFEKVNIPTKRSLEMFTLLAFEGENDLTIGIAGNGQLYTEAFQNALLQVMDKVFCLLDTDASATIEDVRKNN